MQSDAPSEQGSSDQQAAAITPSTKRRRQRQSPRASKTIAEELESLNERQDSGSGSPQKAQRRGSSRGSEMHRSSTPPEASGSVKYTRTGRVSKATKGQRIHHCDECGKTYTRAEHLRRHQQNHKPGAFPCDIPGCGRSFYREDLLSRHKARHNDPSDPPTRRPSIGSQASMPGIGGGLQLGAPTPLTQQRSASAEREHFSDDVQPAIVPSAQHMASSSAPRNRKHYIPIHELHPPANLPVSVSNNGNLAQYPFGNLWEASPPNSEPEYESPANEYYYASGPPYYDQPHLARPRHGSGATFPGDFAPNYGTQSPISAGSSTVGMHCGPDPSFNHFSSASSSEDCFGGNVDLYANAFGNQRCIPAVVNGVPRMMSAEERDALMEMDELPIPNAAPLPSQDNINMNGFEFTNEQKYLCAFWAWVHPIFAVVHKPSFDLHAASPLLKSAMLALGAHMLQTGTDMENARIIHERCVKVLKKRSVNGWHTYRVCDMQAIFLMEVYAIFKSRRPPLQLSKNFEDIFRSLASDPQALTNDVATQFHDSPMQSRQGSRSDKLIEFFDTPSDDVIPNQDRNCKQRLLLSCYILDQQHASLFGRQRTECMAHTLGVNLPFARTQAYWDALPAQQAEIHFQRNSSGVPYYEQVYQALGAVPSMIEPCEDPHDAFRSTLMLACLTDPINDPHVVGCATDESTGTSPILFAVEQSPRMRLAFHTSMLCKHTPIRDLLAVAGESWVMAEKLSSQGIYTAAQIEARDWAKGFGDPSLEFAFEGHQSPVQRAVYHALRILEIHQAHPKTGLMYQEWAIYLAAVVIWARAYVTSTAPLTAHRLSIPSPTEPRVPAPELEQTLLTLIANGSTSAIGLDVAKKVLLWTKSRTEIVDVPHNCGLTNGALDVLRQLITRGDEQGWFG